MGAGRILVVDDDPLVLKLVQTSLQRGGYDVLLASDGEEGLEVIRCEHPDLIISDIMMPKVDGFEFAQKLREDPIVGRTPLILLSAKGEDEDIVKGLEVGADDYITKPFSPRQLVARVNAILRRREIVRKKTVSPPEGPFSEKGLETLAKFRFDGFVVGAGNRAAFDAAKSASLNPGMRFNPLFLFGGSGLGKTHLMCALANAAFDHNTDIKALYLTSEVFSQQIMEALEATELENLKSQYLATEILLIDDIQFLVASPSIQNVAADVFSKMYDQGKQIVISSDRKPEELHAIAAEISNGFAFGLVAEVGCPDATLRSRILQLKAKQNEWPMDNELLDYLANELDTDVRTLEGAALRLVAMKNLTGISLGRDVVDGVIRGIRASLIEEVEGEDARDETSLDEVPSETVEAAGEPFLPAPSVEPDGAFEPKQLKFPDPLAMEFARDLPVARILGLPEKVAVEMPGAGARPAVVLGPSSTLVLDTVEALVGRRNHSPHLPKTDRWAYMVHIEGADPKWVLLGTNEWNSEEKLCEIIESSYAPVFVVVLDSRSPKILDARKLISSIPHGMGMVVVVLVSVPDDGPVGARHVLVKSMRRLFRVPAEADLVVAGKIDPAESRNWLRLALD